MKKRRILYLLPFATLVLGGCTFNDVKNWVGKNIYFPVRNWIDDMLHPTKPQEEKLTEKALLEAASKTVAAKSGTAEVYIDGELYQKYEFEGPRQLTVNEYTFYYELVEGVTHVFYQNPDDQSWAYLTNTQEEIIGLNFTDESINELKEQLHNEKNTVEYGKDYCIVTFDEDSVLESVIQQYPDNEAAIREAYKASETKASMKLTVKDGYFVGLAEVDVEVALNTEDTEGTSFVANVSSFEEKLSKLDSTKVARPAGIESVPPEEEQI